MHCLVFHNWKINQYVYFLHIVHCDPNILVYLIKYSRLLQPAFLFVKLRFSWCTWMCTWVLVQTMLTNWYVWWYVMIIWNEAFCCNFIHYVFLLRIWLPILFTVSCSCPWSCKIIQLSNSLNSFQSKECLEKVAQTISFLAQPGEPYLLLLTGRQLFSSLLKCYNIKI